MSSQIDPKKVLEQESSTPETIRFLRDLVTPGSPGVPLTYQYITESISVERILHKVLNGRLPAGLLATILGSIHTKEFRSTVLTVLKLGASESDIRTCVKKFYGDKGVHFEYGSVDDEV